MIGFLLNYSPTLLPRRPPAGRRVAPISPISAIHFLAILALGPLLAIAAAGPVEIIPRELRGASQPQPAASPDGRLHVVFGKGDAIFHTSSLDGRSFSPPVTVGRLEKLALGRRRGPRVSATDRRILVTAISHADGLLHAWTSVDAGQSWSAGAPLNTVNTSAREGLHALAGDVRGFAIAAWLDLRGGGMELWSRASRDGGLTWEAESRIYASPDGHICQCCHPSLALGPKGEIAAMWRNALGGSRDLWLAVSADAGRTFGAAQKLGEGTWKLNACPMDGGALAYDAGGLQTVWRRESALFAAAPGSPEQQLTARGAQPVIAVAADGKRFIAWEENDGIQLLTGSTAPRRLASGHFPALAPAGKLGGALLVWEGDIEGKSSIFGEVLPWSGSNQ